MLESDLSSQVPDPIHEVLPLSVDDILYVLELCLRHVIPSLDTIDLHIGISELVLLGAEVLLELDLQVLLLRNFLLHDELHTALLLEFSLRFEELLLLLHCLLHLLISLQ